jgi:hypothetical protein
MTHRSDNTSQRRAVAHPSASLPRLEMTSPDAELVRLRENLLGGFGQAPDRCKPMEPAGGHLATPAVRTGLTVRRRPLDTPSLPPAPRCRGCAPMATRPHRAVSAATAADRPARPTTDPTMTCAMMNRRTHP